MSREAGEHFVRLFFASLCDSHQIAVNWSLEKDVDIPIGAFRPTRNDYLEG